MVVHSTVPIPCQPMDHGHHCAIPLALNVHDPGESATNLVCITAATFIQPLRLSLMRPPELQVCDEEAVSLREIILSLTQFALVGIKAGAGRHYCSCTGG